MGVRLFSQASRLANRGEYLPGQPSRKSGALLKQQLGNNVLAQILFDGTVGVEGLPASIPPSETWVDASTFYKLGLNIGPAIQNTGRCNCTVYGCMLPSSLALNPSAAQVAQAAPLWQVIATLTPGQSAAAGSLAYTLWRIVFTPSGSLPGGVSVVSY